MLSSSSSSIFLRRLAARSLIRSRTSKVICWTPRRTKPFSSSSSSSSNGNGKQPLNPQQERAQQLHNELEGIVKKHDMKHTEELKKAKSLAGFFEFLSKHKTNISVIVVSFLTVVLSVKMVQAKQNYRELEKQIINTQGDVDQKRNLLRAVTDESFVHELASKCEEQLNNHKESASKLWGGNSKQDTATKTVIASVLEKELYKLIGDEALTEDEKNAKKFKELQGGANNTLAEAEGLRLLAEQSGSSNETDLENMEVVEDASGKKVVKKSVFRI